MYRRATDEPSYYHDRGDDGYNMIIIIMLVCILWKETRRTCNSVRREVYDITGKRNARRVAGYASG